MIEFEKWVQWVFDHPVSESASTSASGEQAMWYSQAEIEQHGLPSAVTIEYLTRLFRHSNEHLHPYSDAQLSEGLWFLVYNACSNHLMAFLDDDVPLEQRIHGIQSILDLFRDLFATRCTNHLSHLDEMGSNLDEKGARPLNLVCYMWWELAPFYGVAPFFRAGSKAYPIQAYPAQIDKTALGVMEQTLYLNNEACIESALHGLGHFVLNHPRRANIIERFLEKQPDLRRELVEYAHRARTGSVL